VSEGTLDAAKGVYTLTLTQSCGASPGQATKAPFHIPVKVGLLNKATGEELVPTTTLELTEEVWISPCSSVRVYRESPNTKHTRAQARHTHIRTLTHARIHTRTHAHTHAHAHRS